MLKLHNKKFIKIISLIMIQSFLFTGMLYPESNLRVPMGFGKTEGNYRHKSGTPSRVAAVMMFLTSVIGANGQTPTQISTSDNMSPPGITIVDTKTQQLEENLPTQEEQNQILENFRDVSSHNVLSINWEKLVNKYGSEKVFYTLKTAIDKKIINDYTIGCICYDLESIRRGDKEVDSFLAAVASKEYIEAYHALYHRLKDDFIKVPGLVITEKAVSKLSENAIIGRGPSSSILSVIFFNPDNANLIDPVTLHKILLKMSIKLLDVKTVSNLIMGKKIDNDQVEQLKKTAFLLASAHFVSIDHPDLIPQILKGRITGGYDDTNSDRQWKTRRPNMIEMYIYPEKNTLPKSEYRPASVTDQPPVYYSIKNWSKITPINDTAAWPSDFLKKLSEMKKGEILYFNEAKYFSIESPQFQTGIRLGYFLQSFGRDDQGIYMSVRDIWDFKAGEGSFKTSFLFEARLMDQVGTPIPIYDRYYFSNEAIEKELERRGEKISALNTLKEKAVSQEALRACL